MTATSGGDTATLDPPGAVALGALVGDSVGYGAMEPETVVALLSAGLAAIIAVSVPWMTFRLALRQDQVRWLREQRAQLYADLLTEAYAEQQYFDYQIADDDTQERMRKYFVDLRLPPLERARLGARGTILASRSVNRLFTRLQAEASNSLFITPPRHEGDRLVARVRVGRALDELQAAIRRELGADTLSLAGEAAGDATAGSPPSSAVPSTTVGDHNGEGM
jgi:hypothetical protein